MARMTPLYFLVQNGSQSLHRLMHDLVVENFDRVPEHGCLIASNHQSFFDPPLVGGMQTRPIWYLARKSLFQPPIMDKALAQLNTIPVDQDKPDRTGLKRMIDLLRMGDTILMFPEGSRTPDGNLLPAQPGIGLVVAKTQVDVVPVRIFGAYEAWPRWGKPSLFKPLRVSYGHPIEFSKRKLGSGREDYQAIGDEIMAAIAAIE